ncbi:hypothetical protein ABPG75_006051 [Micractinium tetrahymenae]
MTCAEALMDPCSQGTMCGCAAILKRHAAAHGYRLADYDAFNIEYPDTPTPGHDHDPNCPLSYGSRAHLGGNVIYDNFKGMQPSHIFLHKPYCRPSCLARLPPAPRFLHTLGINHANGWSSSHLPTAESPDNYLDYYSITGFAYALSCPGYPHMTQLLPGTFKPTMPSAAVALKPGAVSTWRPAPDWSQPAAGGGLQAALKVNVAPPAGRLGSEQVGVGLLLHPGRPAAAAATWFLAQVGANATATIALMPDQDACEDFNAYCPGWAATGECSTNPAYMLPNCRVSCGVCTGPCQNDNTQCSYWASVGECTKNPGYMLSNCKLSCGVCQVAGRRRARQLMAVQGAQPLPNSLQVRLAGCRPGHRATLLRQDWQRVRGRVKPGHQVGKHDCVIQLGRRPCTEDNRPSTAERLWGSTAAPSLPMPPLLRCDHCSLHSDLLSALHIQPAFRPF